jgi:hypothetical protein
MSGSLRRTGKLIVHQMQLYKRCTHGGNKGGDCLLTNLVPGPDDLSGLPLLGKIVDFGSKLIEHVYSSVKLPTLASPHTV